MLSITVPAKELYDRKAKRFIRTKETTLQLEHSLVSISKWEMIWCVPFLAKTEKTNEQTISYIQCMTITQNVDKNVYMAMTSENIKEISDYINMQATATTFSNNTDQPKRREIITSELVYYWMVAYQIPFECQKWHLNRLLTLIRICNIKNNPQKKMSRRQILEQNKALNAARRNSMGSSG